MTEPPRDPLRRSYLQGLLLLGALPALPAVAAAGTAAAPADLAALLEPLRAKGALPALGAAVARAGAIVAAGVTGVRMHGRDEHVTLDDRFHIGSDTKAMTATLAGMAVDQGQLGWDATVGAVLGREVPGLRRELAAVTLEQLLSHSSGLPGDSESLAKIYFSNDTFQYNLPELRLRALRACHDQPLVSPPGQRFHYSNLGYLIAGAMLERTAGVAWEELITRRLFEPLQLHSAGLGPQARTGRIDAAIGHEVAADGSLRPVPWGDVADNPPMLGPAGVAHISVRDFATWAAWNAGQGRRAPALVTPATLARIHRAHVSTGPLENPRPGEPTEGQYALGWALIKTPWAREPLLTHNGSNTKNLAKIVVDTGHDLGLVVLSNVSGPKAEDALNAAAAALYRQYLPA